jgi:hypothetical protein
MREVAELRDAVNQTAKRNLLNMLKQANTDRNKKNSNAVPKIKKKKEPKFKEITIEDLA